MEVTKLEREIKETILKDGDVVPYTWKTANYGRAEFDFCVIWKRGKIVRVHIWPRQQVREFECWVIESGFSDAFHIQSWTHKGVENPWPWRFGWCREHKTQIMNVYVPPDTDCFRVSVMSGLSIIFERTGDV